MIRKLAFIGVVLLASCIMHSHCQTSSPVVCVNVDFPDCRVFQNKTAAANTSSVFNNADVVSLRTLYTQVNCSQFSYFFICAAAYPFCIAEAETIRYPCRDMCLRVKQECREVLSLLNTVNIFNCDTYAIGGRCVTQDEALIAIKKAGLHQPDKGNGVNYDLCKQDSSQCLTDDPRSSTKGLVTTWAIYFICIIIILL